MALSLREAAASSVAARGLMYALQHPAPSAWQPLKGPTCAAPERAAAANGARLAAAMRSSAAAALCPTATLTGGAALAADALPYMRLLAAGGGPRGWLSALLPSSWSYCWEGQVSERPTGAAGSAAGGAAAAALAAALAGTGLAEQAGGAGAQAAAELDEIESD